MVKTNCPNCGAPISTDKCPFCGTSFIDLSCMNTDEPFWLKVRHKGKVLTMKVQLKSVDLRTWRPEAFDCFGDRCSSMILSYDEHELGLDFDVIPVENIVYRDEPGGGDAL